MVDVSDVGPVRCARCKAYMNPYMRWNNNGRNFTCNFCGLSNNTPDHYFNHLGPDGRRRDAGELSQHTPRADAVFMFGCGSVQRVLIKRRRLGRRRPASGRIQDARGRGRCCAFVCQNLHPFPRCPMRRPTSSHNLLHPSDERPELCRGTVEFLASQDYVFRPPMAPAHVFVIDVSATAIATGATASLCRAVAAALDRIQGV